jgi:PST family polysaccharide transporter
MSSRSWGQATRSGLVWTSGAYLLVKSSTLLTTLVLARLLAPAEFGVVAAILVFLTFVELGSAIGLKATVVFEQEDGVTRRVQTAFTLNLVIGVLLTALAMLVAPAIAGFFQVSEHVDLFRLGAANILIIGLGNIQDSLLLRELEFRRRIVPEFLRAVVRGGVSIALAFAGLEAAALVWGMLAGSLVWTATQWALTRFRPDFSLDLGIVRSMVSYGSGAALLELLAIVAGRADAIVVGRVLGERALGLYTVAFRLPEALIDSISWNMSAVAFPALARKRAEEREGFAGVTLRLVRFQALYALPVAAGLAVLAPPLVVTLFGDAWREAGGVLAAVAVMSGIHAIVYPLGDAFKAVGRQRLLAGIVVLQLPLMVGAIVLAAPAGILVVAWVRAAATILHSAIIVAASGPVLGVRSVRVFQATVPAMAAAAGVAAGAGMVRLAWPALSAGPVVLGALAGAAGGALALRYVVPGTLGDMARQVRLMRGAARERVPEPAASS